MIFLALSAFALLAVAAPARASTTLPKWSAGDYWSYSMTVDMAIIGPASGRWRMDVVGTDPLTIGGTTFDAYHVKDNITLTITYGNSISTITEKGDSWYRASDLAEAKQVVSLNLGGAVSTTTTTNAPPPGLQWPLTPGATWTQAYEVTAFLDYGSLTSTTFVNVTTAVAVQSDTSITVPAGTFNVTQVTESGLNSTTTSSWSEKAGNRVARESSSSYGQPMESMRLESYSYGQGNVGGLFLGFLPWTWTIILVVAVGIIVVAAAAGMRRRSRKKRQAPPAPPMAAGAPPAPSTPGPGEGPPPKG